jgi:hypothetical protein
VPVIVDRLTGNTFRRPPILLGAAPSFGGFINAERIVRLADERGGHSNGWIALLGDGEEVALASYYSAPRRIERDLPDLAAASVSVPLVVADCGSGSCCEA